MKRLLLMICSLLIASQAYGTTLYGWVSNQTGYIGVLISLSTGRIDKVHRNSPAAQAGMLTGDIVAKVNGKIFRASDMDGDSGSIVDLTINRKGEIMMFTMVRVPVQEIDVAH